jgi:hypothetical protein
MRTNSNKPKGVIIAVFAMSPAANRDLQVAFLQIQLAKDGAAVQAGHQVGHVE